MFQNFGLAFKSADFILRCSNKYVWVTQLVHTPSLFGYSQWKKCWEAQGVYGGHRLDDGGTVTSYREAQDTCQETLLVCYYRKYTLPNEP